MLSIGRGCKAKCAEKWLSKDRRGQHTDPMLQQSERKIIHRIISRIDGVTSYSDKTSLTAMSLWILNSE